MGVSPNRFNIHGIRTDDLSRSRRALFLDVSLRFMALDVLGRRRKRQEKAMIKTIALVGLAALVTLAPVAAFAQSSYGSQPGVPTQSLTPFDRAWNAKNESKSEARAGAAYMRRHFTARHYHYPYHW